MSNDQLPGSNIFDSQIKIHTSNQNNDVSLAKQFQKNTTKENNKNGVIDQGKCKKISMKRKWKDRHYHVQYNADVAQKYVKCIVT